MDRIDNNRQDRKITKSQEFYLSPTRGKYHCKGEYRVKSQSLMPISPSFIIILDKSWAKLEALFSKVVVNEDNEEDIADDETTYYDSLCPTGDNQEYVAKLKEDIMNLRKEYSKTRKDLGEENLVKRSFLEDLENTKTRRNSSSLQLKERNLKAGLSVSDERDVWFGSGMFQDSGERMRMGGGRRFSESRLEKVRKVRTQEITLEGRKSRRKEGYKELMDAVKINPAANISYGRERMLAWLLNSHQQ